MDGNKGGDRGARRRRVPPATYTVEEVKVVREIMNKKDYYEILGLKSSCTTKDAHKAFDKLSLKVHPEKNSAPRAEEAFKMVSKAFDCLSNEESRKIYDRIESDHEHVYEKSNSNGGDGGGGANQNPVLLDYHCNYLQADPFDWAKYFVFVIIGAMATLAFAPVLFHEPWIYSDQMSESYNISLTTPKGMNYYVQSADFEQQYPPNSPERVKIEQDVEGSHELYIWRQCKREIDWLYRFNELETPNCDELKRLKTVFS